MVNALAQTAIFFRILTQRLGWGVSMLCFSLSLVACGGVGSAAPRFTWDASTSVLKDNNTGLLWTGVTPGSTLTSGQRLPTVDELLLLTDKATLSDIPTQFSTTLLNNDLVFASDSNYSRANAVWAVSFDSLDRGALYAVGSSETPTDVTATKQPVIVSGSAAAFNRSRANSNYASSTTNSGVIYDIQNDLSWKMCSEAAVMASSGTCSGTPKAFSLSELTQFLAANRADGWRLPTKYELEGLLDRSRGFEASTKGYMLNTAFFDVGTANDNWWDATVSTGQQPRIYWTATQDANAANNFVVSFDEGSIRLATQGSSYYVRLVRNGRY
jgi:hypothetical protein